MFDTRVGYKDEDDNNSRPARCVKDITKPSNGDNHLGTSGTNKDFGTDSYKVVEQRSSILTLIMMRILIQTDSKSDSGTDDGIDAGLDENGSLLWRHITLLRLPIQFPESQYHFRQGCNYSYQRGKTIALESKLSIFLYFS